MITSRFIIPAIFTVFVMPGLFAQNRAPSLYLDYQDAESGDIIINTLNVASPAPLYTYYCGLLWNGGLDAGGYCGMQVHPDGRNFIFSLWDPISSSDTISADYAHPATQLANFGGEGTGLRSLNFGIHWETGQWYSLVSRAWSSDTKATYFGYWVYDHSNSIWYHLVTMKYPVPDLKFNTRTSSFIEDWQGNGSEARTVYHKNGWKRRTSDKGWIPFDKSYFDRVYPDEGTANYIEKYNGGVIKKACYFMTSGGNTKPATKRKHLRLFLPFKTKDPGFAPGGPDRFSLEVDHNNLLVNWNVLPSKAPQFSYHIQVYDNREFSGMPLLSMDHIRPHIRKEILDISSLTEHKKYYVKFFITDVFDNTSTPLVEWFVK